jgi:hypothetical protein
MAMSSDPAGTRTQGAPAMRVAAWLGFSLVVVIILALAFPVYIPLKYRVPGFQALTPNKILMPLLVPVAAALALSPLARRRWWNPLTRAFAVLTVWELTSAAFNATGNLVLNFKNLLWLVLAFVLHLVFIATVTTRRRTGVVIGAFALLACLLSVLGFVEIYTYNAWDQFFMLFRPQLIAGDMVGNGPEILLPLHNYYGPRRILQSTLGSFTVFALLATFLFGMIVEALDRPGWRRRGQAWLLIASFWLMASATWLTFSRAAFLQLATGVATGLVLSAWKRRRIPWAAAVAAVTAAVVVLAVDPESVGRVAAKFDSTRYGLSELQRVESSPQRTHAAEPPPVAVPPPPAKVATPAPRASATVPGAGQAAGPIVPSAVRVPAAAASAAPAPAPSGSFSVAQRLILAGIAVDMGMRYPVFGAGPLNFRPLLYGDPHYQSTFRLGVLEVFDAHNFYLQTLATTGPIGLLVLIGLLLLGVRRLTAGFGPSGWTGGALGVTCLWAAFLTGGFFGFSLLDPVSDIVFAFVVSAAAVVCPFGSEPTDAPDAGRNPRGR